MALDVVGISVQFVDDADIKILNFFSFSEMIIFNSFTSFRGIAGILFI